jgi:dUTP pyrophosphatase
MIEGWKDIRVLKVHPDAILPTRSHDNDAGWDLYVCQDTIIQPGKWEDIACGIAIEPPTGVWFRIVGRSSTFRKRRLLVLEGIIDEGFRGELFAGVTNLGSEPVEVIKGERLCQMIPQLTFGFNIRWDHHLTESSRGTNGFGSSGT